MRKYFLVLIACCFAFNATADEWLPNFEDVPLMEKTYVVVDDGFVYSVPDGKIVRTTVTSEVVTRRQLQRFYRDSLKELGWTRVLDEAKLQIFRRNGERLEIEIVNQTPLAARFVLTPD